MGNGFGNRIEIDVFNIGRKTKICPLYSSDGQQNGAAHSIKRTREMNGWKEQSFILPVRINGEINWRAQYMTNEYELRVIDGDEVDWYRLTEPQDTDDGLKSEIKVTCPHASAILKKRNIYLAFDDENGIGTMKELAERALDGTGWTLGRVDTIYESDGVTEKVRSYQCNEKTGAYQMIQGICDKFVAYPVFHGDTMTVDLLARTAHEGMLEMMLDKNLASMARTRDSADVITRLYVEGEYGDLGYVGIDDVNPTGLSYLLDFSYYREIGALTQEQETAIADYLTRMPAIKRSISEMTQANEQNITTLAINWGVQGYVVYPVVNGVYQKPYYGSGATEENAVAIGDSVAMIGEDGTYSYTEYASPYPAANVKWMLKFVTPAAGTLGGKEVAIEAKEATIRTLEAEMEDAESQQEKDNYAEQISTSRADLEALQLEAYEQMLTCIGLAINIGGTTDAINNALNEMTTIENAFVEEMGDLLLDGYYSDETYAPGQEEALYNDAVMMMNTLCRPQNTYSLKEKDLANVPGYSDELFTMNMAVHFYNETLKINDFGFVSQISEYLDRANTRTAEIKTDELDIQNKSFSSFLGRITDAAQIVKDKQTIYDRARALNKNGTFGAEKLEGVIDVLQNRLLSAKSNWSTDENGNILFVAADESSAMMLSGSGQMVAKGKTEDGQWNWRTFGTGEGFTADLITAGILRAGIITILGSDQFYWTGDNLYIIEPNNESRQIRIGRYDGINLGIGYTNDGGQTWQNAIDFNGVHLSATDSEAIRNAGIGGRNYQRNSRSLSDASVV